MSVDDGQVISVFRDQLQFFWGIELVIMTGLIAALVRISARRPSSTWQAHFGMRLFFLLGLPGLLMGASMIMVAYAGTKIFFATLDAWGGSSASVVAAIVKDTNWLFGVQFFTIPLAAIVGGIGTCLAYLNTEERQNAR